MPLIPLPSFYSSSLNVLTNIEIYYFILVSLTLLRKGSILYMSSSGTYLTDTHLQCGAKLEGHVDL